MTSWMALLVFLFITAGAAATGAMFPPGDFYAELAKPHWNPPAWIFGPVWTVLYIMIAIAGWLVWREQGMSIVLGIWTLQLVLNALWTFIAFNINRLDFAFYDITVLWITILLFIILAWPVSRIGAVLFVPYIIWVSFAGILNFTLWRINPVMGS